MFDNIDVVEVTERMLTAAARAGDLDSLMIWSWTRQGVRVTSAVPLYVAVQGSHLEAIRCLVRNVGADVNQIQVGLTPMRLAVSRGDLAVVRCLIELGAEIGGVDRGGNTSLLESAREGRFRILMYLLKEAGANMDDVNTQGKTVWDMLIRHLEFKRL
jgi:ankyrin repeat protein